MTNLPLKSFYSITAGFVFVLTLIYVFSSVQVIHFGSAMSSLEKEKTELQARKTQLESQQAQTFSIGNVEQTATAQGFVAIEETSLVNLPADSSVALR